MLYPHSWDAAWSSLRERRRETWGLIISQHKICMNPEFPNFWNKKTKWKLWMEYVGRWKVSRHIHITKIFSFDQCTIGLSPFNNCTREICPFAPIFQRSNCFRVKYLEITFTFDDHISKKIYRPRIIVWWQMLHSSQMILFNFFLDALVFMSFWLSLTILLLYTLTYQSVFHGHFLSNTP